MSDTYTYDQLYNRNVWQALLIDDQKIIAEGNKKRRKKRLKAELQDYIKYEGELKKRGVSKYEALKNMKWEDRYIDPRKIENDRIEAKKMVEDGLVGKDYFKGLLDEKKSSRDKLKIKQKKSSD